MRSVGLITEYNPFHNGHLHHLRESLKVTGADAAVAVMSGHFLQRGEPALVDKWRRAEMALRAGADLVLELPLPWACNSAPLFAEGAIRSLDAIGVSNLCFGSEAGEKEVLQRCADLLDQHRDEIEVATRALLRRGENYPMARAAIIAELTGDKMLAETLAQPNNILGIEYLRALKRCASLIVPATIQRVGAGFHDLNAAEGIASATGIRKMVADGKDVAGMMPISGYRILQRAIAAGEVPDENILLRLLVQGVQEPDRVRSIYQVRESDGIENRFYKIAQTAETLEQFTGQVKSKQLTRTRIQRLMIYILLGLDTGIMSEFLDCGPLYLHVLGHSEKGEGCLAQCRKGSDMPLVGNYSRIRNSLTRRYGRGSEKLRLAQEMLSWEIRATRTWTLLLKWWSGGNRNLDFFRDVIRVGGAG